MKKLAPVEIVIILLVLGCLAIYFIPKFTVSYEQKQYTRMQTNAAMLTSKILAEFSDNTNKKSPSEFIKPIIEEMNKTVKNPINSKNPAYSTEEECLGCIVITSDDKVKSVTLAGKDKEGTLVVRTLIQAPSYVTYNKDFNKK